MSDSSAPRRRSTISLSQDNPQHDANALTTNSPDNNSNIAKDGGVYSRELNNLTSHLRAVQQRFAQDTLLRNLIPNKTRRTKFCLLAYNYQLYFTALNWLLLILVLSTTEPDLLQTTQEIPAGAHSYASSAILFQVFWLLCGCAGLATEVSRMIVRPNKVALMYVATFCSYAMIYLILFAAQRADFLVAGYEPSTLILSNSTDTSTTTGVSGQYIGDVSNVNNWASVSIFFLYFSITIQTNTGFGDISPTRYYTMMFVNSQMMIGITYHMGIFALTLSHFKTMAKNDKQHKLLIEQEQQRIEELQQHILHNEELENHAVDGGNNGYNLLDINYSTQKKQQKLRLWSLLPCFHYFHTHQHPFLRFLRHFIAHYILLVSILLQSIAISIIWALPDPLTSVSDLPDSAVHLRIIILAFVGLILFFQFLLVLTVSIRLINNINSNDLKLSFLAQSYFSTALFFSLLYFVLFTATSSHEFSIEKTHEIDQFSVLSQFMYFSVTAMSGTGFGDIYARGVGSRIAVAAEMLVAIIYQCVIIGVGLSILIEKADEESAERFKTLIQQVKEKERKEQEESEGEGIEDEASISLESLQELSDMTEEERSLDTPVFNSNNENNINNPGS
jgi:hypothetical protein